MSEWRHHLPNFLHKWWCKTELLFKTAYNIYTSWESKMERKQTTASTVLQSSLGHAGISEKLGSKPKGILNSMALSSKLSKILMDHFVFRSLQYSEKCKICKLILFITFFFFTAFIFHSVKISLWQWDVRLPQVALFSPPMKNPLRFFTYFYAKKSFLNWKKKQKQNK